MYQLSSNSKLRHGHTTMQNHNPFYLLKHVGNRSESSIGFFFQHLQAFCSPNGWRTGESRSGWYSVLVEIRVDKTETGITTFVEKGHAWRLTLWGGKLDCDVTNGNSGVTRAFSAHFDLFLSHFGFRLSTRWCRPVRNHTESDKNVGWIDTNGTQGINSVTQLDADKDDGNYSICGCPMAVVNPKLCPTQVSSTLGDEASLSNKTHLDQTCCVIGSICVSTLYSTSVPSVFQHSQATHPICWDPGMQPIRGSRREHEKSKAKGFTSGILRVAFRSWKGKEKSRLPMSKPMRF